MRKYSFINTRLKAGIWEGDLTGACSSEPILAVSHQGTPLDGLTSNYDSGRGIWRISVPVPPHLINDGLQTFVVSDESGATVTSFSLLAGDALADDLRAEINLLRNELDLLKKAFRQHCQNN